MNLFVQHGEGSSRSVPRLQRLVPRLVLNFVFAPLAYTLVRPHVGGDAVALAIAGTLPTAWTIAFLVLRGRFDPIGALAVVSFGAALLISVLTGGSSFPLKLQGESLLAGVIGFVFLVSVAVQRPILPMVLRLLGRGGPMGSRASSTVTALIGATLLIAAVTHLVLALALPTSTYLVVSRMVGLIIYGIGGATLLAYRHKLQAHGHE